MSIYHRGFCFVFRRRNPSNTLLNNYVLLWITEKLFVRVLLILVTLQILLFTISIPLLVVNSGIVDQPLAFRRTNKKNIEIRALKTVYIYTN